MTQLGSIIIISGGQTGADRAALDFAIEQGIEHGGWCPRGRLAEDGRVPLRYALRETPSRKYAVRTEWNIRDSDATVVFSMAANPQGGTRLTLELARRLNKPVLHLCGDTAVQEAADALIGFILEHEVKVLNVAGPRESQEPTVADFVMQVLRLAFVL